MLLASQGSRFSSRPISARPKATDWRFSAPASRAMPNRSSNSRRLSQPPQTHRRFRTAPRGCADYVGFSWAVRFECARRRGAPDRLLRHEKCSEPKQSAVAIFAPSAGAASSSALTLRTNLNAVTPPEQRIEFRVGINLGDVITEREDIFSDGVNLAAQTRMFGCQRISYHLPRGLPYLLANARASWLTTS
jgi:hypothetical protein